MVFYQHGTCVLEWVGGGGGCERDRIKMAKALQHTEAICDIGFPGQIRMSFELIYFAFELAQLGIYILPCQLSRYFILFWILVEGFYNH